MTPEQFIVGSIMVTVVTAISVWQWLFMPRLRELEDQRAKWQLRAETAEHEMRSSDAEGMRLVGDHDWGQIIPQPWETDDA